MKKIITCAVLLLVLFTALGGILAYRNEWFSSPKKYDENNIGECYFHVTEEEHIATSDSCMYADNEILVVAKENVKKSQIEKLTKKYEADVVGWIEQTGDYQWKLNSIYSMEELEEISLKLENEDIVESSTINYIFENNNESINYGEKWSKDLEDKNDGEGKSWGIEIIEAPAAWDLLEANSNKINKQLRLGLIDSGVDNNHEDLEFAEVFYNTNAGKHGTHVAGIMAAKSNNDTGICGVYPYGDGNLYSASWSGAQSYSENKISCIYEKCLLAELILRNVKVINCSYTYKTYNLFIDYWTDSNSPLFNKKRKYEINRVANILGNFLERLIDKGYDFIIISAAGNQSNKSYKLEYNEEKQNIKTKRVNATYTSALNAISKETYPKAYERIVVVGAVNSNYEISDYSNGGNRVDIYAPGGQYFFEDDFMGEEYRIYSTLPNNSYGYMHGTSMAAPHVSGVAAMVWAANSSLSGADVKNIICSSKSLRCTSCNMIDAYFAVSKALGKDYKDLEVSTNPQNGGILCWVVDKDNEDEKIEGATIIATNIDTGETESTKTDSNGHFELFLSEGNYTLTVTAKEYDDYTYNSTIEVKNNGVNYLDDWIKMTKSKKEYTESDLKEKVLAESGGNILSWFYEDYDGNGTKEAFSLVDIGTGGSKGDLIVYFIDADGNIKIMYDNFWHLSYYDNMTKCTGYEGKKFFSMDLSGGGSGYSTFLASVKDGNAYELDISNYIQGFFVKDGICYTTEHDFSSGYHEYPEVELIYNSGTQQFTKGQRIEEKPSTETAEIRWQDIYASYLRNAEYTSLSTGFDGQYITSDHAKFHLVYLDNDEIPELLITGGYSVHIITIVDGKVKVVTDENGNDNFSWYGNFYYRDYTGYFINDYERSGTYLTPVYQMDNGKANLQVNIEYDEFYSNGNIQRKFLIDNNEVSEQEYIHNCENWNLSTYYYTCSSDNWQRLDLNQYGSAMTNENIKSYIENNPN